MTLSIYAGKSILVVNLPEVHSLSLATQRLLTWMTTAQVVRRVYKTFRLSLWKISGAWPLLFPAQEDFFSSSPFPLKLLTAHGIPYQPHALWEGKFKTSYNNISQYHQLCWWFVFALPGHIAFPPEGGLTNHSFSYWWPLKSGSFLLFWVPF